MSGIKGLVGGSFQFLNPSLLTSDIELLEDYLFNPSANEPSSIVYGSILYVVADAKSTIIHGARQASFLTDYYNTFSITPSSIQFGTIATSTTKYVEVWNGFIEDNLLITDLYFGNGDGLTLQSVTLPINILPFRTIKISITANEDGQPKINDSLFIELSTAELIEIPLSGSRVSSIPVVPEVGIEEEWIFKNSVLTAVDGTEQRLSILGINSKNKQTHKFKFDSAEQFELFRNSILSNKNKTWLAEYQYSINASSVSYSGGDFVYCDADKSDFRNGDYVMLKSGDLTSIVTIDTVSVDGFKITSALDFDISENTLIIPGATAIIDDTVSFTRGLFDNSSLTITATLNKLWTSIYNTAKTTTITEFKGCPVVDKRPLADNSPVDKVWANNTVFESETTNPESKAYFKNSKQFFSKRYFIDYLSSENHIDYWKKLFYSTNGGAKKFFIPSYRNDLILAVDIIKNSSSITVKGSDYATIMFANEALRFLAIASNMPTLSFVEITSCEVVSGNSILYLAEPLPNDSLIEVVKTISYLYPVYLNGNSVKLTHNFLDAVIEFDTALAEGF